MKQWARRSKTLIILFKIWQNWILRRRFLSGSIETTHGSSLARKSLSESLVYIRTQYDDYRNYGELVDEELIGKTILELGYGDNVGVALRFLAAGAQQVVCLDKFYSKRDITKEQEIYVQLRGQLNLEQRERFDEAIDVANDATVNCSRLTCLNGIDLEASDSLILDKYGPFDIVLSRAMIEEIYEPERIFGTVDKLLKPGGLMLHKIDLSDYGMFSDAGMNPLTFLTIPESVYRLMASDSGIPNRKPLSYYQEQMKKLSYDCRFLVTSIIGHGSVDPHQDVKALDDHYIRVARPVIDAVRPRLAGEFKRLADEELMISGLFLVGRKPAAA